MIKTEDIVLTIANRLTDIEFVKSVALKEDNCLLHLNAYPWVEQSLSHGYPGLVILFSELDALYPNEGWDAASHSILSQLVTHLHENGVTNYSLFSGLTGICFSILLASKEKTRYRTLLTQFNQFLIEGVKKDFSNINLLRHPQFYDVILGVSGIVPYLLHFPENQEMCALAEELLVHLVTLTEPIEVKGKQVPGWYVPPEYQMLEENKIRFRNGCFDLGLAHGITGCLSTLSHAHIKGMRPPGGVQAMQTILNWLQEVRISGKVNDWPSRLVGKEGSFREEYPFYLDGWCYGAPGVLSALHIAGQALNDKKTLSLVKASSALLTSRTPDKHFLYCPSFCHGYASLLTISRYLNLSAPCDTAYQAILQCYNPDFPFGFKCNASPPGDEPKLIDNPGLLEGTVGILLSLLYYSSKEKRPWLQVFNLF